MADAEPAEVARRGHEFLRRRSSDVRSARRCSRSASCSSASSPIGFLPVASLPSVEFRRSAFRRAGPAPIRPPWRRASRRRSSAGSAKSPGVTEITSVQLARLDEITVQFDLSRNIDGAARDVQAALNAAATDLPGDLPTLPIFRKTNPAASPDPDSRADLRHARRRARSMMRPTPCWRSASSQVEGVAEVTRQRRRSAGDARARRSRRARRDGRLRSRTSAPRLPARMRWRRSA